MQAKLHTSYRVPPNRTKGHNVAQTLLFKGKHGIDGEWLEMHFEVHNRTELDELVLGALTSGYTAFAIYRDERRMVVEGNPITLTWYETAGFRR